MSPIKLFFFGLLTFSSAAFSAEKGNVNAGVPLDVKQYSEVGRFDVDKPASLYMVKFNNKIFVLSNMPDRRLYDLVLNVDKNGREVLCGKIGASLKMNSCYYIYFREK